MIDRPPSRLSRLLFPRQVEVLLSLHLCRFSVKSRAPFLLTPLNHFVGGSELPILYDSVCKYVRVVSDLCPVCPCICAAVAWVWPWVPCGHVQDEQEVCE